ncbi:MAG TPA: ABC transporter permease, partial [Myxococcales bacterium]|nr:ABC transporter permease [Myxococcales bacterium]
MGAFFFQRVIAAALVICSVSVLVFLLIHWIPGDPVEVMLGESAKVSDREALRQALGLHLPVWDQGIRYFSGLLQGDIGQSLYYHRPVSDLLWERLPATFLLAFSGISVALLLAIPAGILAAVHQGTAIDRGAMGFSLLGVSMPNFWLGPLLILVFSVQLGWFPVSGYEASGSLVLPAITLGTAMAAVLSRMLRASLLEVLHEDFIRSARAKGLSYWRVIWRHALPNAALPVLTLLGLQLGVLLGGA